MKRSLILLLVVALLATMVPTMALAAQKGWLDYFDVAMPIVTGVLSRTETKNQVVTHWTSNNEGGGQFVWTRVGSADGKLDSTALQILWSISDVSVVGFADQPQHRQFTQKDLDKSGKTLFPKLDGRGVGVATITGKAYWADDDPTHDAELLGTTSFIVEIKPMWENKVTIEDTYEKDPNKKEKEAQTHTYWLTGNKTHLEYPADQQEVATTAQIPDNGVALETRAHVHYEPKEQKDNPNSWAATYGVSELVWTSSDESIARVDKHGRVWFTNTPGTVTITATAKEEAAYPHTPKFATITYVIKETTNPFEPSREDFKKVEFTADSLDVERGCSSGIAQTTATGVVLKPTGLNIARFLELYPKPVYTYQGTTESPDIAGGDYGVWDNIDWSSSNENLIWICRDSNHYANVPVSGPNWQYCFVEVSEDAKPGDKVTITARSRFNPALFDTIELVVVGDDTETARFERTSVTVREDESVDVKVYGTFEWDKWVTLTSLNPDIASVTPGFDWNGNKIVTITGAEPGTTTISLESLRHKFKATIDVTVVPNNGVKSVTVPERFQNITMPLYDVDAVAEVSLLDRMNTTEVSVNINPDDAWFRATWTSSDPSVAYVVYDGNANLGEAPRDTVDIRAAGVGKCKITVTIDDGIKTFKRSMNITVVKAKATKLALNVNKATVYLHKGGDNTLQLTATDKKTDEAVPVTWTSSDKTIAKVSKTGLVTFKKEGTVKITAATKDGYKAEKTCTITVKKLPVSKIVVDSKKMTMKVGETSFVQYRVNAKAYNQAVSFKSSDKKVVKVDKYGNLEALKAGKAEITITAKDGSGVTAKVIITVKGVAENTDIDVVEVVEDEGLELTLDGIDGIEDLGIEDEVVLDNNEVIELAID